MSACPRVLHVVSRAERRGAETSAVELAERLAEEGFHTDVVALAPPREGAPLPVDVLGPTTLGHQTLRRLRSRMDGADVVIAHGSRTMPAVVLMSTGRRQALIYQNIGDPGFWAGKRLRRWRVRMQLRRMSAVAALTEGSMRILRDRFGVSEQRMQVIGNWRDADHFRPATETERAAARRKLGLPPGARVACVVGALSVEKDVGLAIRATLATPDVTVLVVGDGPERAYLEALAMAQGDNTGRVRFLGAVADVRPALHASDALLLTSASEGVPGVIIEAGLCGLPVVTTDVGFVADVVVDGETGHVVTDRAPTSLSQALVSAIDARHELGERARARCRDRYDSAVVTDQWRQLIVRAAADR